MNCYDKLLLEVLRTAHGKPSGESCQESSRAEHSVTLQPPIEPGSLIHPVQSALAMRVLTRLSKDVRQLGCLKCAMCKIHSSVAALDMCCFRTPRNLHGVYGNPHGISLGCPTAIP